MKIEVLRTNPKLYSCRVYHVRGDWNSLSDVNTMIDVGTDGYVLQHISELSTGVGKKPVEQVVLTHEHFDHTAGLKFIIEAYSPVVYSYAQLKHTDIIIEDDMIIKIGNEMCRLIHTPGHSHDSICVYCPDSKVLFAGDTSLNIKMPGGSFSTRYVEVLEKLAALDISTIYSGHDEPFTQNASDLIKFTLENVKKSRIVD